MELEVHINGVIEGLDAVTNESLLSLLRREGYSSVKRGCETGECGACTVLVDGIARPSCVMLASQVGGCTVSTVESLGSAEKLHPLQSAFVEVGATGCGFCTSGMLLSAFALLQNNPSPTEEDVRDALSGNLCRCNGYARPVQAVLRAAALLRGERVEPLAHPTVSVDEVSSVATEQVASGESGKHPILQTSAAASGSGGVTTKIPVISAQMLAPSTPVVPAPRTQLHVIGTATAAHHAVKAVTGKGTFAGDFEPRKMAYARVLTSPHAHAVISSIDVSQAKALPEVLAVLTYKDVPRTPYARIERTGETSLLDQYCLDYVVRYVGDRVAVVVAETAEVAEEALRLIKVEYDVQPAILDQRRAMEPGAVRVHAERESLGIVDAERNIATRVRTEIGDVEQGFASSDHVIETEYLVPAIQQAPIEKYTVTTYFDADDYLVVRTNSQIPNYLRRTLAQLTGLPMRRIRVEQPEIGGHLGLRQHIEGEDLCALLTLATRRPVRLEYTREDEFRSNHVHQQYILRMKTGVRRDGKILASQMVVFADTGAYGTHALTAQSHTVHALALYPCANMRFLAEVLYTNHAPASLSQTYELQHEFFALESHLDDVARQLEMDALALRRLNWLQAGARYPLPLAVGASRGMNTIIDSKGLSTCLQLVEEKIGWKTKRNQRKNDRYRRGVGIALGFYGEPGVLPGTSGASIKLNEEGSFELFAGRSENGSQLTTYLTQIAAEVLGVTTEDILLHAADTSSTPFENSANDVVSFYLNGSAVKKAAEQMLRQILSVAGRILNVLPESLKINHGIIKGAHGMQTTLEQVAQHSLYVENRQLMTTSFWKGQTFPMTFAAQGVEVEVDVETGGVRVLNVVTAIDAGNPINPMLSEAQIEGDVAQALGLSLSEEFFYNQDGVPLLKSWSDAHVFSATEMPELQTYLVESHEGSELFGSKAVAGLAFYGVAPALANAILNAADIRIRYLAFTPERILRAIHAYMSRKSA
ncbi:molybdopterin-dependent oxidoreductase [Dictyobacter arantiisoli]|uniref:Xanthine dehydrogenase molybdenum-binding subunit XdhA n=1 Tax=Dictyobacter arantiisoli TaxID=2014874 RepID=A0A5A5TJM4_9CHLR|nr:molybdopterin cofactor-binding domain-containing protein [Dictyobacter arantiisoli]GCF11094.1 xanthine dehydrogenase molybdenum-binding subunit XdhA [Dictyobacter arantiisoli]